MEGWVYGVRCGWVSSLKVGMECRVVHKPLETTIVAMRVVTRARNGRICAVVVEVHIDDLGYVWFIRGSVVIQWLCQVKIIL